MATADRNTDGLRSVVPRCIARLGPTKIISMPGCRILKLMCDAHHVICLALLIYTFDEAIGLAIACYSLTIGLVLVALRMTHDRNMQFAFLDDLQEG
jgi:hypothetical protein